MHEVQEMTERGRKPQESAGKCRKGQEWTSKGKKDRRGQLILSMGRKQSKGEERHTVKWRRRGGGWGGGLPAHPSSDCFPFFRNLFF